MRLIYVDESVRPGRYLMAATETDASGAITVRRVLGGFVLPGQRRLHFKSESDRRRAMILDAIAELPVSASVVVVRGLSEAGSRRLLLASITRAAQAAGGESTLFLERVDGSEPLDQAAITRARSRTPPLTWHHLAPSDDPVLWVSDAVAWAVGAGGRWATRADPVVRSVSEVAP